MPIRGIELTPTPTLLHLCDGQYQLAALSDGPCSMQGYAAGTPCNSDVVRIPLTSLSLGTYVGDPGSGFVSENIIVLPRCEACGSFTAYIRTWDPPPASPTSPWWEETGLINALAKWLKDNDLITPNCEDKINAETEEPPFICDLPKDLTGTPDPRTQ